LALNFEDELVHAWQKDEVDGVSGILKNYGQRHV
jgi:hypothetical protein